MSGRPPRAVKRWLNGIAVLAALLQATPSSAQLGNPVPDAGAGTTKTAPAPSPERPVSLQEAVQIAQQNHGRIAAAEEAVEAARQRVRQVRTGTLPTVSGQIGYQGRGSSNLGGLFGPGPSRTVTGPNGQSQQVAVPTDTVQFDAGLQPVVALNYNIFDSGLTRASVRQARAGVESNQANLGTVRNNQTLEVTTNYLLQLRAIRVLELRRVQEDLAAQQLRRVEARIREGAAAEADRALPLSELRNRQVDRILAENDVRVEANRLRNSMGLPVGPSLRLVDFQENRDPLPTVEQLRELAQRQRPEVVQAEAQVRQAQAGVSIARIARKPRLDTTFAFNVSPNQPLQRSDFAVGAAVSLPLFDAGLTHAREQEAKTGVQSTSAQLEQMKKDVTADVEEAYLNLVNARQRLEASRLAVEAAQVNLEQTTARFERGLAGVTVVDLIQAQVQFATASNNAIGALYDIFLAQAQLDRAVGR